MPQDKFEYTVTMHFASESVVFRSSDVLEFYFIEDIFSLSVTGRCQIVDIKGAIERLENFTGDIALSIAFYRVSSTSNMKSEMQSKTFYIEKITALNLDATRKTKVYQILFADLSYSIFNKLRFSYSWGDIDIKPEQIVEDLVKKLGKVPYKKNDKLWDPCKTKFQVYYSPFWNIRQNIQYLIPRIRSEKHDVSGYCFFISSDLKSNYEMNFAPLEAMLSESSSIAPYNKFDFYQAQKPTPGCNLDECKVSSWQVLSFDNVNYDAIAGATYFGYNQDRGKQPYKCTFDYKMGIEKTTILGSTSLFEEVERVKVPSDASGNSLEGDIDPAKPVHHYMNEEPEILENMWYDDWVKRYCQSQMIEVITLGSSYRKIGTLGELYIPRNFEWKNMGDEGSYGDPTLQQLHPRWSGKALIKSITHYFQAKEPAYLQKCILIKNGYEKSMGNGCKLLPASKSNLGSGDASGSGMRPK